MSLTRALGSGLVKVIKKKGKGYVIEKQVNDKLHR